MRAPTTRVAAATALSTVAVLAWGMLFWMVLYDYTGVYRELPSDDALAQHLVDAVVPTGTYFHPWPRDTPESMEAFVDGHRRGHFFKLSYVAEGVDPQAPVKMLWGTLHHALVCLCGGLIVWLAGPGLRSGVERAAVVLLAGTMGTVFIQIGDPIWYHLPWDYPLGVLLYEGVSWALMAGITAGLVVPQGPTAPQQGPLDVEPAVASP